MKKIPVPCVNFYSEKLQQDFCKLWLLLEDQIVLYLQKTLFPDVKSIISKRQKNKKRYVSIEKKCKSSRVDFSPSNIKLGRLKGIQQWIDFNRKCRTVSGSIYLKPWDPRHIVTRRLGSLHHRLHTLDSNHGTDNTVVYFPFILSFQWMSQMTPLVVSLGKRIVFTFLYKFFLWTTEAGSIIFYYQIYFAVVSIECHGVGQQY